MSKRLQKILDDEKVEATHNPTASSSAASSKRYRSRVLEEQSTENEEPRKRGGFLAV